MYKFGTIVLIPFPFTDLTSSKLRPAMIVSRTAKSREDLIVAFISSKIPSRIINTDFVLKSADPDFKLTGLKTGSVFKFDKIATLNAKLIIGELGFVTESIILKMRKNFTSAFGF